MSNVTIYVVVEGPTEQTFVRDVLAPELAHQRLFLHPALIGKPGHKGGNIKFARAKTDIGNFLKQRGNTYVTTMFDFFRIDPEWPGVAEVRGRLGAGTSMTPTEKAEVVQAAMSAEITAAFGSCDPARRFIPYVAMHEFEALLFSDGAKLAEQAEIPIAEIDSILEAHDTPEHINDDPARAPSKRLERLQAGYRKVAYGKTISEAIGVRKMRDACLHFNTWLTILENLQGGR